MLNTLVCGATGSVGTRVLDVLTQYPDHFTITGISGYSNSPVLERFATHVACDFVWDKDQSFDVLLEKVAAPETDLVVIAVPGKPSVELFQAAISAGKHICIASKEAILCSGKEWMDRAREQNLHIVSVDSEMIALMQLIERGPARKYTITASGGPFWDLSTPAEFEAISADQALKHPTWDMGPKITIESALMINKGYELIEAHLLFDIPFEKLDVLIHPQSLIHALATFDDGTTQMQTHFNDMVIPVGIGLRELYTKITGEKLPVNLTKDLFMPLTKTYTFSEPKHDVLVGIELVLEAYRTGELTSFIAQTDNNISRFLKGELPFLSIYPNKLAWSMESCSPQDNQPELATSTN